MTTTRNRRTRQQQEQDRQELRQVLENADGWVPFGYIITRVDSSYQQAKTDLRNMVVSGLYQIVSIPGRGRGNKSKWAHMDNVRDEAALQMQQGDISAAIDAVTPRGRRQRVSKATHPNRCMAWFPAEEQQLIDEVRDEMTLEQMADEHGRTEKAVESRLYKLTREGRIAWTTRTGTPLTDFIKAEDVTTYRPSSPQPPQKDVRPPDTQETAGMQLTFPQRAARLQSLHTCVGGFLNGNITLDGLAAAYDACTDSDGDA